MGEEKAIVEEIRRRVSIVSLVGERVPLKKNGRNFKGLCPFHQEKTPSFMVSDDKQIFHCFGCASGGDVFTFLMKIEGLSFPEALKALAKRAGVPLPSWQKGDRREANEEWARRKEWALRLNQLAQEFFVKNLKTNAGRNALEYLHARGLKPETIEKTGLGYADKSWDSLLQYLKNANAPLTLAAELGLIRQREQGSGHFDFFRDRIIFPIQDASGNPVAFGGRAMEPSDNAKYLNSVDSFLYHKSSTLYGLNFARDSIRLQDEAILVEGYMDALALWQAEIPNAVAPCGTALTPDHLQLLMRTTKNFVTAFDGDEAGLQASFRSLPVFLELGLTPNHLSLPKGEDPDSFLKKEGKEAWEKLKKQSKTLFEFFIDWVIQNIPPGTVGVLKAWEKVKPLLAKVTNPVERSIYLKRMADRLKIPEKELEKGTNPLKKLIIATGAKKTIRGIPEAEKWLIAALVLRPQLADRIGEAIANFSDPDLKQIGTQLFLGSAEEKDKSVWPLLEETNNTLAAWIRAIAFSEGEETSWEKVVGDCLAKLDEKNWEKKLSGLNARISEAESAGNEAALLKVLTEKTKLLETKKGTGR